MKYNVDEKYLIKIFEKIISVPSPVGYYIKMKPVMEEITKEIGFQVTYDNKHTVYITVEGEDNSKSVLLGSHLDTLGFVVRSVDENGLIRFKKLGGGCLPSMEGESVTIHTRDGKEYTGMIICNSHSVHVFDDASTLTRNEETLKVLLDENVSTPKDVKALGIQNGDVISIDPRFRFTPSGYIKSRLIDDKGGVACCLTALKYIVENSLTPKYKTIFAFPFYEEIGLGGTYVPEGVSEFISVDIGLVGPEHDGNERAVSICAKDSAAPYDYELTSRLIELAKKAQCDYAVDVYNNYSTDANASLRAGNNLKHGTFGMAVYCSHGMERTHIDGLAATCDLLLAYLLED
jgi:putative aminopeptidase FrvX